MPAHCPHCGDPLPRSWSLSAGRVLVFLFPGVGALVAVLTLATAARWRGLGATIVLAVVGVVPLIALVGGLSQLPPGSSLEAGLWTIGVGGVAIVLGAVLDELLR